MILGKPDRYLKGLKYENRKGRNQEEESFGSSRNKRGGGAKSVLLAIIIIAIGIGIWFTWQWTQNSQTASSVEVEELQPIIEAADSLTTPDAEQVLDSITIVKPVIGTTPMVALPMTSTTAESISNKIL